ncbi:hypothetical protein ARMSODRAFT_786239 [Armillaria solidipes]|uniref:Uncharacterized protein n=1 Tax=Armillaria solidipes TaxID=1076256 RepID=A0A2H3BLC2_9AGAR|nr:hypothetical protein ARMSODRAFT_786239 [Armillaria solidipes]
MIIPFYPLPDDPLPLLSVRVYLLQPALSLSTCGLARFKYLLFLLKLLLPFSNSPLFPLSLPPRASIEWLRIMLCKRSSAPLSSAYHMEFTVTGLPNSDLPGFSFFPPLHRSSRHSSSSRVATNVHLYFSWSPRLSIRLETCKAFSLGQASLIFSYVPRNIAILTRLRFTRTTQ